MKVTKNVFAALVGLLLSTGARKATKFVAPDFVIKASRRQRPGIRKSRLEILVTIGRPNYEERKKITLFQRAGENFPIRRPLLKFFPKKR